MKVAFYSDPHMDVNMKMFPNFLSVFSEHLKTHGQDAVVISGDISSYPRKTLQYINEIENRVGIPVYFIPGNHDIWDDEDSWKAYKKLTGHSSCISDKIIPLGENHVLIGDLFWYDYSFNNEGFNIDFVREKKYGSLTWQDLKWAKWNQPDEEVNEYFLNKVKPLLDQTTHKKVIFVSHTVPFFDLVTVKEDNLGWNFFNSFIGSEKTGQMIEQYSNIEYAFCGHTHFRQQLQRGNLKVVCNPLGYAHHGEWKYQLDLKRELETVRFVLEL